jgi:hypothetical protein
MATACAYPLVSTEDRALGAGYDGPVFIWDIDKTYLATRFSSARGLLRIPLEFAVDKVAIAGMVDVLRGLRRGPGPGFAAAPLYFVSSSPPQLRAVIARKMLLDGVQPDGFTFKDWGATLGQLKPGRLRDHLGYKFCALLVGRSARPLAREYLFGDDVERDAETYSLYAARLAGEFDESELDAALEAGRVAPDDRRAALEIARALPSRLGGVERIYIHLARGSDPAGVERRGPLVTAVRDAGQLALSLLEAGLLGEGAATAAVRAVDAARRDLSSRERLDDALARGLVSTATLARLGLA